MSQYLPLRPGEPVTLVLPDHVVMVTVNTSNREGFTVTLSSRTAKSYESPWRLDEEGTGWLRGYHLADSPEVMACQAAQALLPKLQQVAGPGPGPGTGGLTVNPSTHQHGIVSEPSNPFGYDAGSIGAHKPSGGR